ncbi:MAG: hypothetical protein JWQ10_4235 [Herbaspirillum sp.]|nr:hypothetical protein [Herbaspirillum sp.]
MPFSEGIVTSGPFIRPKVAKASTHYCNFAIITRLVPIEGLHMPDSRAPHGREVIASADAEITFATLLYRFLFFDWLFVDMTEAKNPFERHAAWQHNREMRRYLPLYLRRWLVFAVFNFGLGGVFERLLEIKLVAAWFFTWSCVTITGMLLMAVMWVFLAKREMP